MSHREIFKFTQITSFSECVVRDNALSLEYPIINNQCSDEFVQTRQSSQSDPSIIQISFTSFQFLQADDTISPLQIRCAVSFVKNTFGS